jgi:2-methylcitrate dehydratase
MELADGTVFEETVEYPIGHKRRRKEGIPLLEAKFKTNLARRFSPKEQQEILDVSLNQQALEEMSVHKYVDLYVA